MNNITWDSIKRRVACASYFPMLVFFLMTSFLFGLTWLFLVQNCITTSHTSGDNAFFLFDFPQNAHIGLLVCNFEDILFYNTKCKVSAMDTCKKISLMNVVDSFKIMGIIAF
jgi:hypothetical protein